MMKRLLNSRFWFSIPAILMAALFLFLSGGAVVATPQYVPEERLDFDPADLVLLRIERVDGKPFLALIRNSHTGKQYEYVKGDFIGPLEVFSIDDMQVELRERLTQKKYFLSIPIDKVARETERRTKDVYEMQYDRAVLFYKTGDKKTAMDMLQSVLKERPHYEDALFFLAFIYHENKYYKEAYDLYLQIVRDNPKNYKAMFNMAEILADNKKLNDAVFMLKKCLALKPDYDKALALNRLVMDEIDYQKNKEREGSQDEKIRMRKIEELKKSIAEHAENIKRIEGELTDAKRTRKKTTEIEAELTRVRLLYDNNSRILEELLKK